MPYSFLNDPPLFTEDVAGDIELISALFICFGLAVTSGNRMIPIQHRISMVERKKACCLVHYAAGIRLPLNWLPLLLGAGVDTNDKVEGH